MTTLKTGRRDGTAMQIVFALMLAVIVGAALWWGFLRENAPMGAQGIRVQANFTAMPDGPAPDYFDGGQPATMMVSPDDRGDQCDHLDRDARPGAHSTRTAGCSRGRNRGVRSAA